MQTISGLPAEILLSVNIKMVRELVIMYHCPKQVAADLATNKWRRKPPKTTKAPMNSRCHSIVTVKIKINSLRYGSNNVFCCLMVYFVSSTEITTDSMMDVEAETVCI